jgi:hypothetical protein
MIGSPNNNKFKPKKNIVLFHIDFLRNIQGAAKRAAEFAEYLLNNGYHVTVISSKNDRITPNDSDKFAVLYYSRNNFRYPVIRQILQHIGMWAQKLSRDPPNWEPLSEHSGVVREPFDDGWPQPVCR